MSLGKCPKLKGENELKLIETQLRFHHKLNFKNPYTIESFLLIKAMNLRTLSGRFLHRRQLKAHLTLSITILMLTNCERTSEFRY